MDRHRASWLSGPQPAEPGQASEYPGQQLGLPQTGSRSVARMGRRVGALLVDWLIAYGLAGLAVTAGLLSAATLSTAVLGLWFVLGVVAVRLFGFTPGQWALGLVVVRLETGAVLHVGVGRAAARGLLIALVIPPLFTDSDGRGLHDRITGTAVVRR
jgi:uncharacterized RDD family membrane protein YckC